MFLNMNRQKFGNIQARLFPKYGMVGMSASILALTSYHTLHPEPTLLTYLMAANVGSQLLQSYVLFPLVAKYQFRMRLFDVDSAEYKAEYRKFGAGHGVTMLIEFFVIGVNLYFVYTVGNALVGNW